MPLFNFFDISQRWQLYQALRGLCPRRCWDIMCDLYRADQAHYLSQPENARIHDELARNALGYMREAPALAGRDLEAMAERFSSYGPRLQFESVFLMLWLEDRRSLLGEVLDVSGREHLASALSAGAGVLALPVHLGPSYLIGPLLAMEHPTSMVFNRVNFEECRTLAFPHLPAEAFSMHEVDVVRAAVRALRAGRIFSIFPEVDPRGVGRHHTRVPFLGTTVMAPQGPVIISRMTGAPMLPVTLESKRDGTFLLTCHEPLEAPAGREDAAESMRILWHRLHEIILSGPTEDWEMWCEFDAMQPSRLGTGRASMPRCREASASGARGEDAP